MKTHIHFIGAGNISCTTIYTLACMGKNYRFSLNDIRSDVKGDVIDLETVCDVRLFDSVPESADLYVLTAGAQRNVWQTKQEMFNKNKRIALQACVGVPKRSKLLVVTNPPSLITRELIGLKYNALPFGLETDNLRAKYFGGKLTGTHEYLEGDLELIDKVRKMNNEVIRLKGFTQWTPAWALAGRIIKEMEE